MNLYDVIKKAAIEVPDKEAIIANEERYSYGQLFKRVNCLANELLSQGIEKGDRVAVLLRNRIETIISFYAISSIGAVSVMLNATTDSPQSIGYKLHETKAKALIINNVSDETLYRSLLEHSSLQIIFLVSKKAQVPEKSPFEFKYFYNAIENSNSSLDEVDLCESDICSIAYTSGTSGIPKGVLLTQKNLFFVSHAKSKDLSRFQNKNLLLIPLYHVYSVMILTATFMNKGTAVLMENFVLPAEIVNILKKNNITGIVAVPMILRMILEILQEKDYSLFDEMEFVHVGGAKTEKEVYARYWEINPNLTFLSGYGLTEASAKGSLNILTKTSADDALLESCGKTSSPFELKIVDELGEEVGAGELGEVVLKGPNVMKGYLNKESATKEVLTDEGWLKTGDLGRKDEEGYLFLVDRKKDIIKVGGELISSREIESVINSHVDVLESAVIGIPDKTFGERIKAYVVLKESQDGDSKDIIAYCSKRLKYVKVPSLIEIIEKLPKSTLNKIKKSELRDMNSQQEKE